MKFQPQPAVTEYAGIHGTVETGAPPWGGELGSHTPMSLIHWLWTNTRWGSGLHINPQAQNDSLEVASRWSLATSRYQQRLGHESTELDKELRRDLDKNQGFLLHIPNQRLLLPSVLFSACRGSSLLISLCTPRVHSFYRTRYLPNWWKPQPSSRFLETSLMIWWLSVDILPVIHAWDCRTSFKDCPSNDLRISQQRTSPNSGRLSRSWEESRRFHSWVT